eukprot:SAG31_NODE_9937_length_1208_cov_0.986474_1_plen_60_part_00
MAMEGPGGIYNIIIRFHIEEVRTSCLYISTKFKINLDHTDVSVCTAAVRGLWALYTRAF